MDETTSTIIERVTTHYPQVVKLPSGHSSQIFFDCAKLTPNDLARLAAQAVGHLDRNFFDLVLGVAYNGVLFAAALAGGRQVAIYQVDGELYGPALLGRKLIVASDVVVSGAQLKKARAAVLKAGALVVGYACIVDRSAGKAALEGVPLFSAWQSQM